MYGSTEIQRLRTRIMPSASGGRSICFSSKLSAVGIPVGRLFRCQALGIVEVLHSPPCKGGAGGGCERSERSDVRPTPYPSLPGRGIPTRRPGGEGETPPGRVSLRWSEAQPSTALAVGAFEAAIESAWAHLALILPLEQRAAAALVAPAVPRLVRGAVEDDLVALDSADVRTAQ